MTEDQYDGLMEMLGGIFVQLSRIYDTQLGLLDDDTREIIEAEHEAGGLMGAPPELRQHAWTDDEKED